MKITLSVLALATALLFASSAFATGLATCDSGPQENWKSQTELEQILTEKGWTVRRVKVDGGCYEVYAIDASGEKVEAYFDPLTLKRIPLDSEPEAEQETE
jgi:hypothetical protein